MHSDSGSSSYAVIPQRLLIVDDLVDHALTLAHLLELIGHEVRATHCAVQALSVAEEFRPNMVLTDINMPRMNGFEFARRIRAQSWGREIVICAITGCDRQDHFEQSREAGIDHHLIKPLEIDKFLSLIAESALKRSDARRDPSGLSAGR